MDRRTKYQRDFYYKSYEQIHLAVPNGTKEVIKGLASDKGLSVTAYIMDLIRKDQEGMFDTMQIAEKNREHITAIQGNMHDGYDVTFKDGKKVHCKTKKDVRTAIISYCNEKGI